MSAHVEAVKLPFRFRQSTIDDAKCLHRFNQVHILGKRSPRSEPTERGTNVHLLHRLYVNHLVKTSQEVDYEYADHLAGEHPGEAAILFSAWVRKRIFDYRHIYGTEVKIRLDWNFKSMGPEADLAEAPIGGDLDRLEIDGDIGYIIDLKSNFNIFQPTTFQSIFYPWMLSKVMPELRRIKFILDFVRWNSQPSREFGPKELEAAEARILNEIDRVLAAYESGDYPAMINERCPTCHLECPLIAEGVDPDVIGQVRSSDEAVRLAKRLYVHANRAKRLRQVLKTYSAMEGDLKVENGLVLGFTPRRRVEIDPHTILQVNDRYGLPDTQGLKSDSRGIRKTVRDYPEAQRVFEEHQKDKSSTTFNFSSHDEEIEKVFGDEEYED